MSVRAHGKERMRRRVWMAQETIHTKDIILSNSVIVNGGSIGERQGLTNAGDMREADAGAR